MKTSTRNFGIMLAIVLIAIIAESIYIYATRTPKYGILETTLDGARIATTSPNLMFKEIAPDPRYFYIEFLRNETYVFECRANVGTDSDCPLFVSRIGEAAKAYLGTYEDPRNLFISPDKKNILIIERSEAIILDTVTLSNKTILKAPQGIVFGVYSGMPIFHARGSWIDNRTVSISLYSYEDSELTGDRESVPVEVKMIKIQ